jgi:hypothetical protein
LQIFLLQRFATSRDGTLNSPVRRLTNHTEHSFGFEAVRTFGGCEWSDKLDKRQWALRANRRFANGDVIVAIILCAAC